MTTWRYAVVGTCLLALAGCTETGDSDRPSPLRVGVAAVKLTPCGTNADYTGPVTPSGVWGETFSDANGNGRWDNGETFSDDPENTRHDCGPFMR